MEPVLDDAPISGFPSLQRLDIWKHRLKRLPFLAFTSTSEVSGLTGSLAGGTVLELTGVGLRGVLGGLRL